ncbi:hypothetical protein DICA3_E00628 [Diutina catenulata]
MSDLPDAAEHAANTEVFVGEYAKIYSYLSHFRVNVDDPKGLLTRDGVASAGSEPPHITVFKKKNLRKFATKSSNIYEHNLTSPDIDANDATKSKVSCVRCRKYKKKCSRTFPECSNCTSSEELCIYMPRKTKKKSEDGVEPKREPTEPKRHNLDMLLN